MAPLLIFTHVPKTAGTSFFHSVVAPNFADDELYDGVTLKAFRLRLSGQHRVACGHVAYGLHRFTRRPCSYITFLRDPVERAVSHYYFIRSCAYHTVGHFAHGNSLADFYKLRRFRNETTRMLAGIGMQRVYPLATGKLIETRVLDAAKRNLENRYAAFGITEKYGESVDLIRAYFGWDMSRETNRLKRTHQRPALGDLDGETLAVLEEANQLDAELYSFATALFEERVTSARRNGQTDRRSDQTLPERSWSASA